MYLKSLELIGFKSFAEKTKFEFEPGMTAIVGPNGCGKSNVADALRWVLGEQSAKAMRGAKMEDVIFNGTDTHRPLGMAEVSLTLTDCESALGMEYHEVTITRRVYRSGEGEYFINRAPCRLKDIQRLFMDTGIGTNSYSLMEQGRIDRILSSHPEDRRAVFEEASGITKFKADKKEAIRKLEQTEANLLRLADILREVKRQIISLQRQAGKARRYQVLRDQLRAYDLFASKDRVGQLDAEIQSLEHRLSSINEQDEAGRQDIEQSEAQLAEVRSATAQAEQIIAQAMEAALRARNDLQRLQELVRHNDDRIAEMQQLSERDTRDAEEARTRLAQHQEHLQETRALSEQAAREKETAERELTECAGRLNACEAALGDAHKFLHRLRTEQLESETRVAQRQNELSALEAEERQTVIRRERLGAELAETKRSHEVFEGRRTEIEGRLSDQRQETEQLERQLKFLLAEKADKATAVANINHALSDLRARGAAKQAQIDLLHMSREQREGFPEGTKHLLNPAASLTADRAALLGPLAEMIRAESGYELALEAAIRPWLDAIVVKNDASAIALLADLERAGVGSARMLVLGGSAPAATPIDGDRLVEHVRATAQVQPLLERLLGHIIVVPEAANLPVPAAAGTAYVTRAGSLYHASGLAEFWRREDEQSNPLVRQQLIAEWTEQLQELQAQTAAHATNLRAIASEETTVTSSIESVRQRLEESRHTLANMEGEMGVVAQESKQAHDRVDTVAWELQALNDKNSSSDERRAAILNDIEALRNRQAEARAAMATQTEALREQEQRKSECLNEVTERRVRFAEARQRLDGLSSRAEQLSARIKELASLIDERSRGIDTYRVRIEELQAVIAESRTRFSPLEEEEMRQQAVLEETRVQREIKQREQATCEGALKQKRSQLDEIRRRKSQSEIELAEQKMRRQNLLERVTGEYRISHEELAGAPEPAWENGQPLDRDGLETVIAELRTKIEAMGPVNLVAIEEHRELEERLAFLTTQQQDLVNAKQQLMDLIREINKKTTEMFSSTFEQVNKNFQEMFTKLFGGGQAKLVLVDENDVLESGIEIIARPPGKKLQTVSLLSGGERTMTAVALLFSLYLVKPSPFCMLDELDAALDEANIGRFVKTVQGFLDRSQFVVITHNRQTIAAARTLYGVTMEKQGVSKIVSVKFTDEPNPAPGPANAPAPEPQPTPAG